MPYTLSKQEKAELRRKYLANVALLNRYLPEGQKISTSLSAFNARINDPKLQYHYLKNKEINERLKKQRDISTALFHKYESLQIKGKDYTNLERLIYTRMIPSDDPEAMRYNEKVMQSFILHPEAELQRRMDDLMKFNMGAYAEGVRHSNDFESFALDFYDKNTEIVESGYCAVGMLRSLKKSGLNPAAEAYYEKVAPNFETMNTASVICSTFPGEAFFTMPANLTIDQQDVLLNESNFAVDDPTTFEGFKQLYRRKELLDADIQRSKDFVAGCDQNGLDLNEDGAVGHYVAAHEGDVGIKGVREWFEKDIVLEGENAVKPHLIRLSDDEIKGMEHVFKKDYTKDLNVYKGKVPNQYKVPARTIARSELMQKYSVKMNRSIAELEQKGGLGIIAKELNKGNWKERTFRTTSRQYKDFIQAMKDFENPRSDGYQSYANLTLTANDYLIHKGVHSIEEAMALPQPGRDRALLCLDMLKLFQRDLPPGAVILKPGTNQEIDIVPEPEINIGKEIESDWPPAIEDPSLVEDQPASQPASQSKFVEERDEELEDLVNAFNEIENKY